MKKKMICLISIIVMTIISSCTNSVQQFPNNNIQNDNEENYLLFDENYDKKITLFFKEDIESKYKYNRIDLLQDNDMIFSNVVINKVNSIDNKIEIVLDKYISNFNQISMTLKSGEKKTFYVGQYYLEKVEGMLFEDECGYVKANSQVSEGMYSSEFTVDGPCKDVFDVVCSKIYQTGFESKIQLKKRNDEESTYEYNIKIPIEYYKDNSLKNIAFDIILIHNKINDDKKYFLIEMYIPLDC